MDAIKAARELGKAIQADERYVRYNEAMKANDADMELQELIGEFNLARQNVALEMSKSKEEQNKEKGLHLVEVAGIHLEPMGIYSKNYKSLEELPDGATIAVPNDGSNESRAIKL